MNNDKCNLNCNKTQVDNGFCTILFAEYEHMCPCEECMIKIMCTKNCEEYNAIVQHCSKLTLSKYNTYKKYHDALHKWRGKQHGKEINR